MLFQQLINGLSIGSIYALMAVGYSLIYSLLNFTNFAQPLSVTDMCSVSSCTCCQYFAVMMWPKGCAKLWHTALGLPVVPDVK